MKLSHKTKLWAVLDVLARLLTGPNVRRYFILFLLNFVPTALALNEMLKAHIPPDGARTVERNHCARRRCVHADVDPGWREA